MYFALSDPVSLEMLDSQNFFGMTYQDGDSYDDVFGERIEKIFKW